MQINSVPNSYNKKSPAFCGIVNLPGLRKIGTKVGELGTVVGHEIVTLHRKDHKPEKIPVEIVHFISDKYNTLLPCLEIFRQGHYESSLAYLKYVNKRFHIEVDSFENFIQKDNLKINGITKILGKALEQVALLKKGGQLRCCAAGLNTDRSPIAAYLRMGMKPDLSEKYFKIPVKKFLKNIFGLKKQKYPNHVNMHLPRKTIEKAREELATNPMIDIKYVN